MGRSKIKQKAYFLLQRDSHGFYGNCSDHLNLVSSPDVQRKGVVFSSVEELIRKKNLRAIANVMPKDRVQLQTLRSQTTGRNEVQFSRWWLEEESSRVIQLVHCLGQSQNY